MKMAGENKVFDYMNYVKNIGIENEKYFFKRSVDPVQYDKEDINWDCNKKDLRSPIRRLMFRSIKRYVEDSKNKNVIEVGCGTGWLIKEIMGCTPFI